MRSVKETIYDPLFLRAVNVNLDVSFINKWYFKGLRENAKRVNSVNDETSR
jgi:hypothetical protein